MKSVIIRRAGRGHVLYSLANLRVRYISYGDGKIRPVKRYCNGHSDLG